MKNSNGDFYLWISAKDKEGKEFNSGLIGTDANIEIDTSKIDIDSLAFNMNYEGVHGNNVNPDFRSQMNENVATYGEILEAVKKTGDKFENVDMSNYQTGTNVLWIPANFNTVDKFRLKMKLNFISNGSLSESPSVGSFYYLIQYPKQIAKNVKVSFKDRNCGF